MKRQGIKLQYCPPGMHRSNRAERSIQTFKNHAIATFCTTAKDFPLYYGTVSFPKLNSA
jgi:hypothetical protein